MGSTHENLRGCDKAQLCLRSHAQIYADLECNPAPNARAHFLDKKSCLKMGSWWLSQTAAATLSEPMQESRLR
jgi:hypothetical protein